MTKLQAVQILLGLLPSMRGTPFTPAMHRVHNKLTFILKIQPLHGRTYEEVCEQLYSILEEEMEKL